MHLSNYKEYFDRVQETTNQAIIIKSIYIKIDTPLPNVE